MAERHTAIIGKQLRAAIAADGLMKDASENLAVDVSDFAGTGLEDDGSENLRIAASAAGDGLQGGAGSALAVDVSDFAGTGLEDDGSENLRIAAAAAGDGLTGGGGSALAVGAGDGIDVSADAVAVDVTDIIDTDYGLTEDTNNIRIKVEADGAIVFDAVNKGLEVSIDNVTIGIDTNKIEVKDGGIDTTQLAAEAVTEEKIDISNAPVDGYYLKYVTDHMEWADVAAGYVEFSDIIANEVPAGAINSANVTFTLANSPASGTVQLYLNGIMQEPGSGKDYTIADDTITFAQAPDTGDILLANYVSAD